MKVAGRIREYLCYSRKVAYEGSLGIKGSVIKDVWLMSGLREAIIIKPISLKILNHKKYNNQIIIKKLNKMSNEQYLNKVLA